jgi:asparagine synthase (glutamine-hydrolysing)
MLALDLPITLADNDLPKVSRMTELAGVEVAYPFLSDELVAFSLRVPSRLKLKGRQLRWFFKHALRDFLPREILTKPKQGFGLPFGVWTREHPGLRDLARQSLDALKGRGLVRPEFVDELWDLHQNVHAAYYGVMIWILMILEQWLQAHVDS